MPDLYDPEWLLSYIEGELSPRDAAALEQQLQRDPRLARLVEQLRHDRRLLRSTPLEREPADLLERAMNYLERQLLLGGPEIAAHQDRREARPNFSRWLAVSGLAALVVLSAGLLVITLVDSENLHRIVTQTAPASAPHNDAPAGVAARPAPSAEKHADKTLAADASAESTPRLAGDRGSPRPAEYPAIAPPTPLSSTPPIVAGSPAQAARQTRDGLFMRATPPTTAPSLPAAANAPIMLGELVLPATQPTSQPSTQPATQPAAEATTQPTTQPAAEPGF